MLPRWMRLAGEGAAVETEGVVLKVAQTSVRLRLDGESEPVTLRAELYPVRPVAGETAVVEIERRWRYRGYAYASGRLVSVRLDVAQLGLEPLPVRIHGLWSPSDADDDMAAVTNGVRRRLSPTPLPDAEMDQIIPGFDLATDPLGERDWALVAQNLANAGDIAGAIETLARAVAEDLRYLDGHAHLGSVMLRAASREDGLQAARRHYEVGAAIGRSFLPKEFAGYLRAAWIDNRPFLRCLYGLALVQGMQGEYDAAAQTLWEYLRYEPQDRFGAEELLTDLARRDTRRWGFGES
jgi:tetratricopeptide (TPR) repeat protein